MSAKFYDSDFNTCDDYIEYENKIYKLSYNLDYSSISKLYDSPYRWGETAVLFDDMLGTWNLAHVYSAEGILLGYPNSDNCSDHDEYGWNSLFNN